MKILIKLFDHAAHRAGKKNSTKEVARCADPEAAAIIAIALAREDRAHGKNDRSYAIQFGKRHEDLGTFSPSEFGYHDADTRIPAFPAKVKAALKKAMDENAKWRRIWKFVDLFRPDIHANYAEWNRIGDVIRTDAQAWGMITAENYPAARARLAEIGIHDLTAELETSETAAV